MNTMMKKLTAILLSLLMIASLAACGTKEEETTEAATTAAEETTAEAADDTEAAEEETEAWVWDGPKYDELFANLGKADVDLSKAEGVLKKVLDSGELIIGTSPDYPANEFVDVATGEVKGSEILIAKYIANSLGVELKIESMDFNAVLAAADTGKVDLAISGFGYKADRAEAYELSHGYQALSGDAHHTIVCLTKDLDKFNSLDDFKGLKVDAQANSLQQMYMEDQVPDAELLLVSTLDQAIMELIAGRVDAVALDSTTAKNYAAQSDGQIVSLYDEKKIEFDLSLYSDYAGNVCAVKKGETSFMEVINECIDQLLESGDYATWYYASCDAAGIQPEEEE